MQIESRINYITFLVIGIIFILVGLALDELSVIENVNRWSVNNLNSWYDFLLPWVGEEGNGLPEPWGP